MTDTRHRHMRQGHERSEVLNNVQIILLITNNCRITPLLLLLQLILILI